MRKFKIMKFWLWENFAKPVTCLFNYRRKWKIKSIAICNSETNEQRDEERRDRLILYGVGNESFSSDLPRFFFTTLARKKFQKICFEVFSNVNFSKIYTKKKSKTFPKIFCMLEGWKRNLGVVRIYTRK
jgi:alpha-galactosidase